MTPGGLMQLFASPQSAADWSPPWQTPNVEGCAIEPTSGSSGLFLPRPPVPAIGVHGMREKNSGSQSFDWNGAIKATIKPIKSPRIFN